MGLRAVFKLLTDVAGEDLMQGKHCVCDSGQAVMAYLRSAHRPRWGCLWHILHNFGAACEAGIIILRNALYTMTPEAWEAKRDGVVQLVEELVARDVFSVKMQAKLYAIIGYDPRSGEFGPFRDAMFNRALFGVGACQSSSERFHEYGNNVESRLGLVPRAASILTKIGARVEKAETPAARDAARDLVMQPKKLGGTLDTCDCA